MLARWEIIMKKTHWIVCAAISIMVLMGCTQESVSSSSKTKERIGVYDSRAIAVAFIGSPVFKASEGKKLAEMKTEYDKAKTEGNQKRVAELDAWGKAHQTLLHKQGFSTAPVDNILAQIKDRLPAIKQKAEVSVLVSKWDTKTLAKYPSAKRIDVTMELVDVFNPNERQRKSAVEVQKHKPISLEQAENIRD